MGRKGTNPSKVSKRNRRSISQKIRKKNPLIINKVSVNQGTETGVNNISNSETFTACKSIVSNLNDRSLLDLENYINLPDNNAKSFTNTSGLGLDIASSSSTNVEQSPINLDTTWGSHEEYESIMNHKIIIEKEKYSELAKKLEGNRIVDINYIIMQIVNLQFNHSQICLSGKLLPVGDINRGLGLVCRIVLKCHICEKEVSFLTEDPSKKKSILNTGAVWGTLATGNTYGHMEEFLSLIDVPSMSYYTFSKIEKQLGDAWKDDLWKEMELAGREEKSLAIKNNQINKDGVPWIKVHVDGGWSKRSYGHNYSAASGTAVIIGSATGKVIYVGVRNKYCSICARATNKQIPVGEHKCFRNWSGSSCAMETDILVEGFNRSQEMHGVQYLELISDGDSSVYANIKEKVSYGREVNKRDCTNHCIKNYGKQLYKIRDDTSVNISVRKWLSNEKILQLEKIAQMSLYHNANGDVELLKTDLQLGQLHVFGDHTNCKEYFCQQIGQSSSTSNSANNLIYIHVTGAIDSLLKHAAKLITNESNNKSETFMAVVARFNAGKRLNLIQRGSYETRVHLSGLRYNKGFMWHSSPWKKFTNSSPTKLMKSYMSRKTHSKQNNCSRKLHYEGVKKRIKQNLPNVDYGPKSTKPDLSPVELKSEMERILKSLYVTETEQIKITTDTIGQFSNPRYEHERKNRLTASNFGSVVRRKKSTSCHNLVKSVLYGQKIFSPAIKYGKMREPVAIKKFENSWQVEVNPAGLYIDVDNCFLGASPDGTIDDDYLVEVKCFYKFRNCTTKIEDIVQQNKNTCLEIKNGLVQLKRTHNYYYQIQGQLNICKKKFCYFVVYINDEADLFVELIKRDEVLWNNIMLPKLIYFYNKCILPEICDSRIQRGMRCREVEEEK